MKRIITLTALVLGLTGGIAAADRGRDGWRDRDRINDRRDNNRWDRRDNRWDRRDSRWDRRDNRWDRRDRVRVNRVRPWFRDGRWHFHGNTYRSYTRPVINVRYRDYYRRPALVVENYDPVPGYIWVQGNWSWNGYEWVWLSGRYEIDQSYNDGYYDDTYYQGSTYSPGISGGVTIGGSVSF
ncbi:MAG: hypothetical protein JNL83_00870 [Myxococcales bacterium]|nr:hypothetical protein [Myxococcales bacterium]